MRKYLFWGKYAAYWELEWLANCSGSRAPFYFLVLTVSVSAASDSSNNCTDNPATNLHPLQWCRQSIRLRDQEKMADAAKIGTILSLAVACLLAFSFVAKWDGGDETKKTNRTETLHIYLPTVTSSQILPLTSYFINSFKGESLSLTVF